MSYEQLLDRARSKLPEEVLKRKRFEVPQVELQREGNKTILKNFREICDVMRREPGHLLRYLVGSVGTKGIVDASQRAVLTGAFTEEAVGGSIARYVRDFIMCPTCNRPDTHIIKEGRISYMKCDACGARHISKNL